MTFNILMLLYILLAVSHTACTPPNSTPNGNIQHSFAALQPHFSRRDVVALVTWKGYWNPNDRLFLRELPWAATLWVLPTPTLRDYINFNVDAGMKTNLVALNVVPKRLQYLNMCPMRPVDAFFLDCFLIEERAGEQSTSNDYFKVWYTRTLSCDIKRLCRGKGKAIPCLLLPPGRALARSTTECNLYFAKDHFRLLRQSQLRNSVIYLGCGKRYLGEACQIGVTGFIIEALDFYNVTLKWFYSRSATPLGNRLISGDLDIVGTEVILNYHIAHRYDIYAVISQTYDVFYVKSENFVLTSFANILVESKLGLGLLLAGLIFGTTVLTIADVRERNLWKFRSAVDSMLLLLASFYGTSFPIPRRRSSLLARTIVYTVWFIAILPLSNYLRSELVSRLSVRSPLDVMDTLGELDDALSRKTVTPCFRVGTMTHNTVVRNQSYTNLHAKLSLAFYAAKQRKTLESDNAEHCLLCARQKNHVCFTDRLSNCWHKKTRGFVESKDTLNPVLGSMLVRKSFALKEAFHKLVRRIREGGFFEKKATCPPEIWDSPVIVQQSDQTAELSGFLVLLVVLLTASCFVLLIEIGIGRL